ncbi:MAG TPA: MFS transporter, partial [Planctomycetaceae bacterium]|nr:MFS transporter [Planctomycetaceae bacterium]
MHGLEEFSGSIPPDASAGPWYKELTRYHWFVLIVAALGWLFDTMDQQLFVLSRVDAMRELVGSKVTMTAQPDWTEEQVVAEKAKLVKQVVAEYSGYATTIFLLGWATGGLFFGVLGDRIGRAKTMMLTILIYSLCTGLSALSTGFWDFAIYRFLTGLGVGGEFAVGVSLVAEVMPNRARPFALGLLQALSAIGNITAALTSMYLAHLEHGGAFKDLVIMGVAVKAWRIMFVIGILPAMLAIVIRRRLKEPERWQHLSHEERLAKKAGS